MLGNVPVWARRLFALHRPAGARMMKAISTRFRAYQLGSAGSSFSYCAGQSFRMIEARLTDHSKASVELEMNACGVDRADSLDITSWELDHCSAADLPSLLTMIRPRRIEMPGYQPDTDNGRDARDIILDYQARAARVGMNEPVTVETISPDYISRLKTGSALAFERITYHPKYIDENCSNNNSTVVLYRDGSFNVLSLGDVEDPQLSARFRRDKWISTETDVMVLAHHGADNGFTNKKLLTRVEPSLAICTADYDNRYDHPRQEIRDLLHEHGIKLMTTKTGDVLVRSVGDHTGQFEAINFQARSTEVSSRYLYTSKKSLLLQHNEDTLRQRYAPTPAYRRIRL